MQNFPPISHLFNTGNDLIAHLLQAAEKDIMEEKGATGHKQAALFINSMAAVAWVACSGNVRQAYIFWPTN